MLNDLLLKALGLLVLTPLAALVLERLVATSGSLSVTNADIASFVLSPWGRSFVGTLLVRWSMVVPACH